MVRRNERCSPIQQSTDWAVVNRDDPEVWRLAQKPTGQALFFWLATCRLPGLGLKTTPCHQTPEPGHTGSLDRLRLYGRHNLENVMAAASAALLWGVSPGAICSSVLASFTGLPHRLEIVAEKQGVRYFDDSKGTNVGAVVQSLASFSGPVILLAGWSG